jgi:hypothetical protein
MGTHFQKISVPREQHGRAGNLDKLSQNVGASRIVKEGSEFRLLKSKFGGSTETESATWVPLESFPHLQQHRWIEPGETITEEQLITTPVADTVAYKVELKVWILRPYYWPKWSWRLPRPLQQWKPNWSTNAIVLVSQIPESNIQPQRSLPLSRDSSDTRQV